MEPDYDGFLERAVEAHEERNSQYQTDDYADRIDDEYELQRDEEGYF